MSRYISASPQHGTFAPGFEPPKSDLENLIAGRERELGDLVNQTEFERLLRGDVEFTLSSGLQHGIGHPGALSQNAFSALFVRQGCLKR
jgi:hypothetical protein